MKTRAFGVLLYCLLSTFALHAGAATISLEPSSASGAPGSIVSLDLVVSGLGDMTSPSLGDFDIDIGFDASLLSLTGYTLGTSLGDLTALEALDVSFGIFAPGGFNVAEVSFLTDGELDALQGDTFVLATLDFMLTGLAPGDSTSVSILGVFALGDVTGSPISVDGVTGATVSAVVIPLPGAIWFFVCALGALARQWSRGQPQENCR